MSDNDTYRKAVDALKTAGFEMIGNSQPQRWENKETGKGVIIHHGIRDKNRARSLLRDAGLRDVKIGIFFAASLAFAARAEPPPAGSMDSQIMAPYAADIRGMKQPGTTTSCCDLSDCRPAEWRIQSSKTETYYEVFLRKKTPDGSGWPGGTDRWERVPDKVVIEPGKRPSISTACWASYNAMNNGFFCFSPGGGT